MEEEGIQAVLAKTDSWGTHTSGSPAHVEGTQALFLSVLKSCPSEQRKPGGQSPAPRRENLRQSRELGEFLSPRMQTES